MESRDLVSVSFRVLVSNVSGLVSVSQDFGLGLELLVSGLCMSYFFCEVLQEAAPQKRIYKVAYCSKFNRLKWSRAKLSLLLCCCGENNSPTTLFKISTEFNKNSVCTSETAAHNFCKACNETLGVGY